MIQTSFCSYLKQITQSGDEKKTLIQFPSYNFHILQNTYIRVFLTFSVSLELYEIK